MAYGITVGGEGSPRKMPKKRKKRERPAGGGDSIEMQWMLQKAFKKGKGNKARITLGQ